MSEARMSEAAAVVEALRIKVGFETVQQTSSGSLSTQLRLVGRVSAPHKRNWKVALSHLLTLEQSSAWSLDISQSYFLRNGETFFAWRIIIQSGDGKSPLSNPEMLPDFLTAINAAPRATHTAGPAVGREVIEQPLSVIGPRTSGVNSKGKGARSAGSVPAILQGRRG